MKKVEKINFEYKENTKLKFKIKDIIQISLAGLETFLSDVQEKIPNSFNIIVDHLISLFEKIEDYEIHISDNYKILKSKPQLITKGKNMILSLLNYSKYQPNSIDEEIDIDIRDIIHTFNHFEYFFIDSLFQITTYNEAITYYQNFVNKLTQSRRDPTKYVENLHALVNNFKEFSEKWHDLEAVLEINDDGILIYKVKRCRWAEDLKKYKPEIGYAIMCHQDFERAKNFNPNFTLTRKHTLMEGYAYCDFCYHDTRIRKEMNHPSEDYWKKLN